MAKKKKSIAKPMDLTTQVLIDIRETLRRMDQRFGSMDSRLESMDSRLEKGRAGDHRPATGLHEEDARIRRLVDARFELVNRRLDALEHRES